MFSFVSRKIRRAKVMMWKRATDSGMTVFIAGSASWTREEPVGGDRSFLGVEQWVLTGLIIRLLLSM